MSDDQPDPPIPPVPVAPMPKRVRGKGNKRKARKARPAREKAALRLPDAHAALVAVGDVGAEDMASLKAQIADLNAKLDTERSKRTEAEAAALAAAESQSFLMQRDIHEVPTGKFVKVKRASGYEVKGYKDDGRDILRPIWTTVELPTFFYKIDLPPSGGTDFKMNGTAYYHGATYEFDIDTLRSAKEIVYRCWAHDASINGTNENAYRPKQNVHISARAYG